MTLRIERIGTATLYLGDCRDVLPTLGRVDALIGDPPYGQRYIHSGTGGRVSNAPTSTAFHRHSVAVVGDNVLFDPLPFLFIAPRILLWGAHKFSHRLPAGTWLAWDKVPTGKDRTFGDAEAAWVNHNPPRAMRVIRHLWDGVCVADRRDLADGRVHPMQKPVSVMAWSIEQADLRERSVVLDPWMGSGSTALAAVALGHSFIGIEIEPKYFDIACRRVEQAQRQSDLFIQPLTAPKQMQEAML